RGLEVGTLAEIALPGVPAGTVLAQNPSADASSISAPQISLLTALPSAARSYVMPNFCGQALGLATEAAQQVGLRVIRPDTAAAPDSSSESSPRDIVASQNPPAGSKVLAGSTVSFQVH